VFEPVACDVTSSESVAAMVARCIERFGRLDVLVNNVGGSAKGGPVEMTEDGVGRAGGPQPQERVPRLQARAAAPGGGGGGAIVNVSSTSGLRWTGSAQIAYAPPRPASSSSRACSPCSTHRSACA
jgi:NAD(P)-dependent dehydrogenase (short-subunit alcohol dehydrogenase family)